MVLIIIVSNILVEAQVIFPTPTTTAPKDPPKDPPKTPSPPPPKSPPTTPPPPKTPTPPPPPPPKSSDTTPTETTPPAVITTVTTPQLPPPPPPPTPKALPPKQPEPQSPLPSFTAPASPSPQIPITQSCTTSNECDIAKFCDQGKCQPRGSLGDQCINKDGCLVQFICNKGVCQYKDNGPKTNHGYDVKKAAITGGIIVGIFAVSGFIFVIYRSFKKRKDSKGRELASSIYSTDGTAEFDPIYPFSERSNSFSNSKPTPPSHVPTTNHYDPLPPTGNAGFVGGPGPRKGYYNYYNNDYNAGGYMRQNENERTINLLQQTRGNVMMAPHAPHAPHAPPHIPHVQHPQHPQHLQPHLQQNYNWNYGVPGVQPALPAQQQLMMDRGGLFPVPSIKRQYGGPIPNNMNNDIQNNPINKKKSNNSFNSSNSSNSYEDDKSRRTKSPNVKDVNSGDKQKKTQNLRDLLNSNSTESIPSNIPENYNVESIYDSYARESMFKPKTLEVKLSQVTNDDDSTIDQNISKDSKSMIGRTRSRTFGHTDGSKVKSSTVEEQKSELNGINENDEI